MQAKSNLICHYTSAEGLLGILKNKQLWATHPRYLNDIGEFNTAFNYVLKDKAKLHSIVEKKFRDCYLKQQIVKCERSILDYASSSIQEAFIKEQVDKLISEVGKNMSEDVYVSSFTNYKGIDNNTHWLSYAHNITGYCIVFDKSELIKTKVDGITFDFESVIYNETPEPILNRVAEIIYDELVTFHMLSPFSNESDNSFDDDLALKRAKAFLKINNLLGMYKGNSYENELEVRLLVSKLSAVKNCGRKIVDNDFSDFPEIEFRISKNGAFIPYQPVPINIESIKQVIVRTDSHLESKLKSTEMLLRKFDIDTVVEKSTATLRTTL